MDERQKQRGGGIERETESETETGRRGEREMEVWKENWEEVKCGGWVSSC